MIPFCPGRRWRAGGVVPQHPRIRDNPLINISVLSRPQVAGGGGGSTAPHIRGNPLINVSVLSRPQVAGGGGGSTTPCIRRNPLINVSVLSRPQAVGGRGAGRPGPGGVPGGRVPGVPRGQKWRILGSQRGCISEIAQNVQEISAR